MITLRQSVGAIIAACQISAYYHWATHVMITQKPFSPKYLFLNAFVLPFWSHKNRFINWYDIPQLILPLEQIRSMISCHHWREIFQVKVTHWKFLFLENLNLKNRFLVIFAFNALHKIVYTSKIISVGFTKLDQFTFRNERPIQKMRRSRLPCYQ